MLCLIAFVPAGSSAALAQSGETNGDDRSPLLPSVGPEVDTTVTRIDVAANGTARWSATIQTRLTNESDVDDYEAFQERFRADREEYADRFERRMTGVVSSASESTGRTMAASSFRAETSIQEVPRRWGTVTYSFTWTNFTATEDEAVVVGDVFEGGLYLDADDYLEIVGPDGYTPTATTPQPDETNGTTVVWTGPNDFTDQRPTASFEPASSESMAASASDSDRWLSLSPTLLGMTFVFMLALVGLTLVVASDREPFSTIGSRLSIPDSLETATESDDAESTAVNTDSDTSTDEPPRSAAIAKPSDATASGADAALDSDLLTDENRVRRLLERNDGRMRQADIVDELEWSASKTSRVVSGMADEGTVEKLRIGRENVIDLVDDGDP
uniref:DUF4897 domain-containing protein n=2 Tax=Haloterrigena alkaliphila TaxID=2816475 RepID=A0A8A2VDD6_9EURY